MPAPASGQASIIREIFDAAFNGDKGIGVMTQKTFMFTRWMLMLVSIALSLTAVFFLEVHL
jgi:hypothetical protein